ncbi:hypothetical protein [Runella slithyformis]|uniref:Uncharacterized protein n=1 Tax=Runella slithyformis (strain ATCC 29530 / DSM 19594 / LMG 11500 / NCIMB 11436 / LSU 4) TaxID=761193 RepID=A0A7U3ZI65_RUNSL|nr:hypothetical protein [Runella slithyformis]AEI47667.1 hypothetical protein Runsl_1240 [Runella slithyformis DSM 19594]
MWLTLIVSLLTTGAGLLIQNQTNQATKAAGENLTAEAEAQNKLNAAIQDANYFAALGAQQKEKEAAKTAELANQKRTNQIITGTLITVFTGLILVAIFKLKR